MRKKNPFCSMCKVTLKTSKKRYCKSCATAYMRLWRARHITLSIPIPVEQTK